MSKLKELPKGWKESPLEDLCLNISAGGTPRRNMPEYWERGTIPWLKISDLHQREIKDSEEYVTLKGVEESSTKIFPKGTVLISIFASLGEVALLEIPAATNQAIVGIQVDENKIDRKYLYHYLNYINSSIQNKAQIGTQKNINLGILKRLPIVYCDILTQKKIVSVLDKTYKLIEKKKRTIHLANELLQACFIRVFGKTKDLLDREKHLKLSSVANLRGGITMNQSRREGDNKVPYITIRNLYREEFDLTDLRTISVSESDLQKWKLEYGDLCVLEGGDKDAVGRTAVYQNNPVPCVHQNHIFRVRLNADVLNPFFVSAYFNSNYMRSMFFKLAKATTGINTLNITELGRVEVPIPSMDKQLKFQEMYLKAKELQNSLRNEQLLLHLFQTLRGKLFSGMLVK